MKFSALVFIFFAGSALLNAQSLNLEAIEKYYQITDSLRQNHVISLKTWEDLLAYPGVQRYIQNQKMDKKTLDAYRKNMEYVYMPKNDSILQARLKDPQKYFLAYIINRYKENEQSFRAHYQYIKSHPEAYLDSIYSVAYGYLPKKMRTRAINTTIYFIPIWNDAVAEGNDIVTSLYCSYYFDKQQQGALLAHEMHHILRKNKSTGSEKDEYLYQILSLLLHEGIADLIDKKITSAETFPEDLAFYAYMMELGPAQLAQIDTAIQAHISQKQIISSEDVSQLAGMSGHIPGCFMSAIIERNKLKNKLIKNADDPVKFILLYQTAAKKDQSRPYLFSDKVIRYLKKMPQKGGA